MSATHPRVRREVRHLPPGDQTLVWYRRAVARMQARPHDDPTSWTYQAAIHGTHAAHTHRLFNQCKHFTWFFLPWHRMYLFYFEQIVRAAVVAEGGPGDWALPYWNYGLGGRNASIPRAFRHARTAAGRPNALHVAQRAPGINRGAALPPFDTTSSRALSRPRFTGTAQFGGGVTGVGQQFFAKAGELEQTPHNAVHGGIGGWMNDADRAAADPIFWLHHANIDRLWAVWVGRGHANPASAGWKDQSFTFFDAHGHEVSKRCRDVLDTVADLHYTYDPDPAPAHAPHALAAVTGGPPDDEEPPAHLVGATEHPLRLTGDAERVTVPVDEPARRQALAAAPEPRIVLNVEDVEADGDPATVYGVFVDLPVGAPAEVAALHHAGNLSFFGLQRALHPRGDEPPHGYRLSFDITDLAAALRREGRWSDDQVEVTFRPLELIPPDAEDLDEDEDAPEPGDEEAPAAPDPPVTIGRISVYYE